MARRRQIDRVGEGDASGHHVEITQNQGIAVGNEEIPIDVRDPRTSKQPDLIMARREGLPHVDGEPGRGVIEGELVGSGTTYQPVGLPSLSVWMIPTSVERVSGKIGWLNCKVRVDGESWKTEPGAGSTKATENGWS